MIMYDLCWLPPQIQTPRFMFQNQNLKFEKKTVTEKSYKTVTENREKKFPRLNFGFNCNGNNGFVIQCKSVFVDDIKILKTDVLLSCGSTCSFVSQLIQFYDAYHYTRLKY
jgi:hypothetical protein